MQHQWREQSINKPKSLVCSPSDFFFSTNSLSTNCVCFIRRPMIAEYFYVFSIQMIKNIYWALVEWDRR